MVWGDPDMKVNKVVTHEDYRLMAEHDMNMIQDEEDRYTWLASIYRRAGVQKSDYPMDLFKT
jgi:hypothetical protein